MTPTTPGTTSIAYRRADVVALLTKIAAIVGPEDVPGEDLIDYFMSDLRPMAVKLLRELTPKPPMILTLPSGRGRVVCPHCGYDGSIDGERHLFTEEIESSRDIYGIDPDGTLVIDGSSDESGEDGIEERIMCGRCRAEFDTPDNPREYTADYDEAVAFIEASDDEEPAAHTKDTDCAGLLLPDDHCAVCRVGHMEPCPACQGRGYHAEGCAEAAA